MHIKLIRKLYRVHLINPLFFINKNKNNRNFLLFFMKKPNNDTIIFIFIQLAYIYNMHI